MVLVRASRKVVSWLKCVQKGYGSHGKKGSLREKEEQGEKFFSYKQPP